MNQKLVNILLVEDDEVDVMNVKRAFSKNNIKNPLKNKYFMRSILKLIKLKSPGSPTVFSIVILSF